MSSAARRQPRPERARRAALLTRSGTIRLDRVAIMGVLNATPDSFSDGGRHQTPSRAAAAAVRMAAAGASLIDLGAESSRPGAAPISAATELRRLLPVLRAVRRVVTIPLSIDTTKAAVAAAALAEGADLVNDISAGRFDPALLSLCARERVPIVLMHMRGQPRTMQQRPRYRDVVAEVAAFLVARIAVARREGIAPEHIVLDPGFGFGKLPQHNFRLLHHLERLVGLGFPVLVGPSRKRFIGRALGDAPPGDRLYGTAAAVALAVRAGARIVRVHDVGPMRDVVRVVEAVTAA